MSRQNNSVKASLKAGRRERHMRVKRWAQLESLGRSREVPKAKQAPFLAPFICHCKFIARGIERRAFPSFAKGAVALISRGRVELSGDVEICSSSSGGGWLVRVGAGPTQTCAASAMPSIREERERCPQSGFIANHRATASIKLAWKLNAGLYPVIQTSPSPLSRCSDVSTNPSERMWRSGRSCRQCSALL